MSIPWMTSQAPNIEYNSVQTDAPTSSGLPPNPITFVNSTVPLYDQLGNSSGGGLPITGGVMEGNISMGSQYKVTNLAQPSAPGDAVPLSALQGIVTAFLPRAGGSMNGNIDMNGNNLEEVGRLSGETNLTISAPTDINLESFFGSVNIRGGIDLNLKLENTTGLLRGNTYLDIESDDNIKLSAQGIIQMNGVTVHNSNIDMSSQNIINCANPVNAQDVATKSYVDARPSGTQNLQQVLQVGNIAQSIIDMSNNNIINCADPVQAQDVATKAYVDSRPPGSQSLAQVLAVGNMANTNINMSGNDITSIGTITAGGITDSIVLGSAVAPMASLATYTTDVSINSYNPLTAMNFIGIGGVNINAPDNDINLNAGDINLTQSDSTSIMNLTALGGIVAGAGLGIDLTAGGAVAVNSGLNTSLTAGGSVLIGSGNLLGSDTEVEKVGFKENKIYKVGSLDLALDNVSSIQNSNDLTMTATNMSMLGTNATMNMAGNMSLTTGNILSLDAGTIAMSASNEVSIASNNTIGITSNGNTTISAVNNDGSIILKTIGSLGSETIKLQTNSVLIANPTDSVSPAEIKVDSVGGLVLLTNANENIAMNVGGFPVCQVAGEGIRSDISDFQLTTFPGGAFTVINPNETLLRVESAGVVNIDNTGLTSGNDPKLRLTNVDNQSATITKRANSGGSELVIQNDYSVWIDSSQTRVLGLNGLSVGGNNQSDGNITISKLDETLSATMRFNSADDSFIIANDNNIQLSTATAIDLLASGGDAELLVDGANGTISLSAGNSITLNTANDFIVATSQTGIRTTAQQGTYTLQKDDNPLTGITTIEATNGPNYCLIKQNLATQTMTHRVVGGSGAKVCDITMDGTGPNITIQAFNGGAPSQSAQLTLNGVGKQASLIANDRSILIDANVNQTTINTGMKFSSVAFRTTNALTVADYAVTYNAGTAITVNLPIAVSALNVGTQFLITNTSASTLTVASVQLIWSKVSPASSTTRALAQGASCLFTAIQTGTTTFGWSMI